MRCIGEAELWYTQDPHSQMGKAQMVRQLKLQSFYTKKKDLKPTSSSPDWGYCTRKTSSQNVWL